jgi:hypothetical protein
VKRKSWPWTPEHFHYITAVTIPQIQALLKKPVFPLEQHRQAQGGTNPALTHLQCQARLQR